MTKDNRVKASFKKRYLFKLITNLVGLFVGIITQSIVPRALGPASYGNFSFLTSFFWQTVGFLNLNSSTAFYTKLSQRQNEKGLISFYYFFIISLGLILSLFVVGCFASGFNEYLWPEQITVFVIMAVLWAFLRFNNDVLILISDALGLTVKSETINVIVKLLGLIVIIFLFWKNWFTLTNYFLYYFFVLLVAIVFLIRVIGSSGVSLLRNWQLNKYEIKSYTREFIQFCLPLVVFLGFATSAGILDRWFLQKFSGSVQQGFYGLAYQIGTLCFLFVSAMIPLVMREYAISFSNNNINELRRLFSRFCPMLYAMAAYFSCFIAVEAEKVILIFGGQAYSAAIIPITIMCFYPIHQTYGQLNASFFFATNRTKAYRNIGMSFVIIGIPLTFFLLGPTTHGGLQSGATGLAIKMVLLQLIGVNVQLWFNLKLLNLSFGKFFGHQIIVLVLFLSVAVICSYIVEKVIPDFYFLFQFLISGFLYTLVFLALMMVYPRIFALRKEEIANLWNNIKEIGGITN